MVELASCPLSPSLRMTPPAHTGETYSEPRGETMLGVRMPE